MKSKFSAIEVSIFAVVCLVFLNSVFNLATHKTERRSPATASPAQKRQSPDSAASFAPYETKCQSTGERLDTSASKVRILGPFCGVVAPSGSRPELKVENKTNRFIATVFTDQDTAKFSTDFIPLEKGTNKVFMEFRYKPKKVVPVELTVTRK